MPIAACLIVRNSAATIEAALGPIRPHVDEINIFDTGSTDDTLAVIDRLNATAFLVVREGRVIGTADADEALIEMTPELEEDRRDLIFAPLAPIRVQVAHPDEIPLSEDGLLGDFSWAREESFRMASPEMDWLLWLDDDDVIVGSEHLRGFAYSAHPAVDGFVFMYDYARDGDQATCVLWRERLLRRKSPLEWGWRNAVHEVWLPHENTGIVPNFVMVPPQQARYIHNRPPDRYPATRNLNILERVVRDAEAAGEQPDPRTKAYMGTELMAQGRFPEAIPWLNNYLEDTRTLQAGDERSQVFHKLAISLRALGQPLAAIEVEMNATKERDDWAENAVGLAEAFAETGQWQRCEHWAKVALATGQPQSMLILNPLEFTLVPFTRLAQACAAQRRFPEAEEWATKALQVQPNHPMALQIAAGVSKDGYVNGLVEAALKLREALVRWDENWKAHELFENLPYIVGEDDRVVAARAANRENVLHALKPAEYTRWYADEPKESTVPDEWVPEAGEYIERAKFVLERCQKFEAEHGRKPRVLDLGCNDAWMLGYLWVKGEFVGDGIELNKASVEKAQGRIERFGIPGRIVQGDIHDAAALLNLAWEGEPLESAPLNGYDVVTMFEVFEHVPDTDRILDVMESLLTPEGVACVTTPNGAFEDGNIQMWHIVERKGHLRAWPWFQLAETLLERGQLDEFKIHQGGRLTYASWRAAPAKKQIVLYGGPAWEQWSPNQLRDKGIGGSETGLTALAVHLSARGYDVRVFTDAESGLYGTSLWRPAAAFDPGVEADAIVVSRLPHMFDATMHAPVRVLWAHDHHYADQVTERRADKMTHVAVLSDWQAGEWAYMYPGLAEKLVVMRNGIIYKGIGGERRFPSAAVPFEKRKPHVIFSSSPDRGLDQLLDWWPRIRLAVPDAELHVYYGFETFDRAATMRPDLFAFKSQLAMLIDRAGGQDGGIIMHGRVGQDELHKAMAQARVWGYPTYFKETSCIGAMEARAAGLPIVTSYLGALQETVSDEHGVLLSVPPGDPCSGNIVLPSDYADRFVEWVTCLLTDPAEWQVWHDAGRAGAARLDWKYRIDEWERLLAGEPVHPKKRRARVAA